MMTVIETWYVPEYDFWCAARRAPNGDLLAGPSIGFDTEAGAIAAVDRGGQVVEIAYGFEAEEQNEQL